MEFILDSIDLNEVKQAVEFLPVSGVTSNPSIVCKTAPEDVFEHFREIRRIIGKERTLHMQVVATKAEDIVKEGHAICENIDKDVYIKIPVTFEGVKAIKILKSEGYNVTATAVYDLMQAYMALAAGANYIAPYINRIGNLGGNPYDLVSNLQNKIETDGYDCKIVAASFKGIQQICEVLNSGAEAVTIPYDLYKQMFVNPSVSSAIEVFNNDWHKHYGQNNGICELKK